MSCPVSRTNDCIYNLVSIDIEILVSGVLLWSLVHFVPSVAQPVKKGVINLSGENGYKLTREFNL